MFYHPFTDPTLYSLDDRKKSSTFLGLGIDLSRHWLTFWASVFLVSVPVFIEAPLVRYFPWMSLLLTGFWVAVSAVLLSRRKTWLWGDLLFGFSGSWLAGSLYWGWFRCEPLLHLPIEAIALPLPLWLIYRQRLLVGSWFAVGSLLGTIATDLYFYLVNLIPNWRAIMQVEPDFVAPILHEAIARVHTPWGIGCAATIATLLLAAALIPLQTGRIGDPPRLHRWAFSGAVLSTILVDILFWLAGLAA
ncbi:MAG: DUF3120 domain-containing protein [Geitlerinemataceae cyanobacterium]